MASKVAASSDEGEGGTDDEKIIREATKRFDRCADWEDNARKLYLEDIRFVNGDSDNLYQWSEAIRTARGYGTLDERPCLTINKTRQHCLQIINDAKQNKPSVKIKPVGNGATYEAAQIYEGIVRHIEYISNAQAAYDTATTFQVQGGIGWIRVVTDYPDDDSFDQEIFIRRVKDPLTIYMDPDIREVDGSDARFAFVFDDMTRDEFKASYPKYKDMASASPLGVTGDWLGKDHVRVAEYYRVVEDKDQLVAYTDPATQQQIIARKSKIDKELFKTVADDPGTKLRSIVQNKVEWFLIVGDEIAERTDWVGRDIPLIRVIGEETVIEGNLDRKGHTRAMKDPQRMYNYHSSAMVEGIGLQSKTPIMAAQGATEGLETYYETANTVNHAWIPYNQYDDQGRKNDMPQRQQPPVAATAFLEAMKIASDEIMAVSGQHQSDLGMPSNEKSGIAIQQRQRQGDNATYHYIDNLAVAIRRIGKILVDIIPKVYDTPRVIKIMAEDGVENEVVVDPQAQAAYLEKQKTEKDTIQSIFNPSVGKYDVEADVGPAYATRRQEAFNAFMQIASQNPELMKIAGDLMFMSADFPMADELSERIKRTIPPYILGEAPPPEMLQLQQQTQNMQGMMSKMMESLVEEKAKTKSTEQQKEIDIFKAVTDRLSVILKTIATPKDIILLQHDLASQEHAGQIELDNATAAATLAPAPDQDGNTPAPQSAPQQPQQAMQ